MRVVWDSLSSNRFGRPHAREMKRSRFAARGACIEEDEVELATTHASNDDYEDSAYERPYVDASYYDEEEESCSNDLAEDGTGGTSESVTEPQCKSPCSMFLKLKAILALERQPIPVAELSSSKCN